MTLNDFIILLRNKNAEIYIISSAAHEGLEILVRALKSKVLEKKEKTEEKIEEKPEIPTISLKASDFKETFKVEKTEDGIFVVTGEKIEKFARRTDMDNYASVNRLRDIMKKMGIRAELTSMGVEPESIIEISGKQFTLVEDW